MLLLDKSTSVIKREYLEVAYTDTFAKAEPADSFIGDKVIDVLIKVCEKNIDHISDGEIKGYISQKLFDEIEKYTPDKDSADHLIFSQKADAFFYCYKLFLNIKEEDFEDKEIYQKILAAKDRARERKDFSFLPEIIVSFTSFPARIDTVYRTLVSVYSQTIKPDRVILWLAESQFPGKDSRLPMTLLDYKKLGLEIRWCSEDIRPHKKYYYAMKKFRKAIIITIDDDIIYDRYMLETLLASYLNYPDAVSALRTHLILPDEAGNVRPYRQWKHEFSGAVGVPSMQLLATGCAGILYPPGCIDIDSFTIEDINALALNADDMWLKIMQVKKGTPVVLARENRPLVFVPDSQEVALYKTNSHKNENDIQLTNIINKYDADGTILKAIFADGYTRTTVVQGVHVIAGNGHSLLGKSVMEHEKAAFSKYISDTEADMKNISRLKEEIRKLNKDKEQLSSQLKRQIEKANKLNGYLLDIKDSLSFRIGRLITWLPRYLKSKIKGR